MNMSYQNDELQAMQNSIKGLSEYQDLSSASQQAILARVPQLTWPQLRNLEKGLIDFSSVLKLLKLGAEDPIIRALLQQKDQSDCTALLAKCNNLVQSSEWQDLPADQQQKAIAAACNDGIALQKLSDFNGIVGIVLCGAFHAISSKNERESILKGFSVYRGLSPTSKEIIGDRLQCMNKWQFNDSKYALTNASKILLFFGPGSGQELIVETLFSGSDKAFYSIFLGRLNELIKLPGFDSMYDSKRLEAVHAAIDMDELSFNYFIYSMKTPPYYSSDPCHNLLSHKGEHPGGRLYHDYKPYQGEYPGGKLYTDLPPHQGGHPGGKLYTDLPPHKGEHPGEKLYPDLTPYHDGQQATPSAPPAYDDSSPPPYKACGTTGAHPELCANDHFFNPGEQVYL